ncbi:MAG: T9SS type A sorting domain-containing protein, partial [Bacteroidales bacterium]|nr:T9SS type A sorting domain-containing protein [Bacteroidales bacterium]
DNTFHFSPRGDLLQASNGKLYGKNVWGGANEKGSIYEYDIINNTFVNKIDFSDDFGPNAKNFGHLIELNPNQLGNEHTIKEDEKIIIVYPNPSTGIVNINIANFNTPSIKIYNVSGQLIYNDDYVTGLTYSLELNDKPGIYFVEVSSISKKQVIKLIKK